MAGVFITTSQRSLMRPLACQGILVSDCFYQISSLLKGLSPQHSALLAEPVLSTGQVGRETIDWYASPACGHGDLRNLSSLPSEERESYLNYIHDLAADIQEKSTSLSQSEDPKQRLSGEMLRLALQHPHEEDIWLLGDQPIVVNWGFASGTMGAQPEDLARKVVAPQNRRLTGAEQVAAAAVAAHIAQTEQARKDKQVRVFSGCLIWLLPFLLFLLLLLLLLSALGLIPYNVPLPASCMPENKYVFILESEKQEQLNLEERIKEKQAMLLARAALCPPTPTQQVVAKRPLQMPLFAPEKMPDVQVVAKRPLKMPLFPKPVLPPPVKEELVEPKKEVPAAPPKREIPKRHSDNLEIPKDAKRKNDLSFLEGCWISDRGLVNSRTRRPIVVEYCFGKNGKGRRIIRESRGMICTGSVTARFSGNTSLSMTAPEARCPRGTSYVGQRVQCTGNDNSTVCHGRENNSNTRWDARFRRK